MVVNSGHPSLAAWPAIARRWQWPGAPPLSRSDRLGYAELGHPLTPNPRHSSPASRDGRS